MAVAVGVLLTARGWAQEGMSGGNMRSQMSELSAVFFPPTPPPLGRLVSRLTPPAGGRFAAPADLAAYVNEPFYPPLSTRLQRNNLSDKLRQKLATYHSAKLGLQAELRTELDRLHDADAPARRAALEALARRQTSRITELETTAEELRAELITGASDWSAYREWHLGSSGRGDRGDSPSEVAQVMRATAYYQAGLLPAQRRLLREISLEVAMSAEDEVKAAAAQPFLFFPPEPARVLLPDDLPADLAALVAEFQAQKSALKKELYDLVYREDDATFNFTRAAKYRSLATQQATRLATLERLAEQIRGGLGQLPGLAPAPLHSPLTPLLTERTITLIQRRAELQGDTRGKLDEVGAQLRTLAVALAYQFDSDGIKTTVVPRRIARARTSEETDRIAALRAKITAIEESYKTRNDALVVEIEALRRDVSQSLGNAGAPAVDTALNDVARYAVQRENEDGYRDYRIAVFEPGLSPEQRRLLFDGAIEKLALPLPRGDLQPMRRAPTW